MFYLMLFTVLAIGFYATYAPPPLALYGSAAILILAFITRFLPLAYTACVSAIRNIHPEMEEAVHILGGRQLLVLRSMVAPLLKRPLVGAWILVFVPAVQELSTAVFLVGPKTRVMSLILLDLSEQGNPQGNRLNALCNDNACQEFIVPCGDFSACS